MERTQGKENKHEAVLGRLLGTAEKEPTGNPFLTACMGGTRGVRHVLLWNLNRNPKVHTPDSISSAQVSCVRFMRAPEKKTKAGWRGEVLPLAYALGSFPTK